MKNPTRQKAHYAKHKYSAVYYPLVGAVFLAISGCVTSPLKTDVDRDRVAEAMGYHPSEIDLMHLCFFKEIEEPESEKRLKGVRGVVAKSDTEICLMDGAIGLAPRRHFIKIPLSEIEGVGDTPGQVQIKYQDKLFVLVVYNWEDFRPNSSLTNDLRKRLIAANVPHLETQEHYSWSMLSPKRDRYYSDSRHDNPPTNYEASIGSIMSQERAKEREMELLFPK